MRHDESSGRKAEGLSTACWSRSQVVPRSRTRIRESTGSMNCLVEIAVLTQARNSVASYFVRNPRLLPCVPSGFLYLTR